MSLPVTSVYVTARLGFGNALAGLAVGIAFVSTIVTRGMAGRIADQRGGVAPIFALAIVPIIGLAGAAVDYSRAAAARSSRPQARRRS